MEPSRGRHPRRPWRFRQDRLALDSPLKKGYGRGFWCDWGKCWACWGKICSCRPTARMLPMNGQSAARAPAAHPITINPSLDGQTMNDLDFHIGQLVIANRILANEAVVDAYGHVSMRHPHHPERYLLACSRSPELVERADMMEFTLDGNPVSADGRALYLERFIHGAIYEARPDVQAVVHAHAEDVLPFCITTTLLRPVIHSGSFIGTHVPVWDIADTFGDHTNLLVTNMPQGRDLARCLGSNSVALMRGHGFAAAAQSLIEVVRLSVYVPRNARVLMAALRLGGEVKSLSQGEIAARAAGYQPYSVETWRAWEYWAKRAGCGDLIGERPVEDARTSNKG
jgi:ribulose-5-phosphate 4-epimerase/fuculose-1-phosphate aldolase